ncbi:MAG TPA: GGDEF domain-containing protein, partial [Chthonomonadales bacterium]|nr:GGDEF domain-containing protein [Chthonomonadales bacterium]
MSGSALDSTLRAPASVDALTGAYSRERLQERLALAAVRAREADAPLAVCVIDLDHFKSINDAYGHTRGDQVLRELVQR